MTIQEEVVTLGSLTIREREVLRLIACGHSNARICEQLWVTPKTLESHISRIFRKLNLRPEGRSHRRVAAALAYLRAQQPSAAQPYLRLAPPPATVMANAA